MVTVVNTISPPYRRETRDSVYYYMISSPKRGPSRASIASRQSVGLLACLVVSPPK